MTYITLLELDGIRGNSKVPGHWGDIELQGFSIPAWNMQYSDNEGMGIDNPQTTNVDINLNLPSSESAATIRMINEYSRGKDIAKGEIKIISLKNGFTIKLLYQRILMANITFVGMYLPSGSIDVPANSGMTTFHLNAEKIHSVRFRVGR